MTKADGFSRTSREFHPRPSGAASLIAGDGVAIRFWARFRFKKQKARFTSDCSFSHKNYVFAGALNCYPLML